MRTTSITLGGKTYELVANFAASIEIARKVHDPLEIVRQAALEQLLTARGMPYTPKWQFTVENVPLVIHIGLTANESDLTLAEVQDLCFEAGFVEAQTAAVEYITCIVGPSTEEELPEPKDKPGKKKKAATGSGS